MGVITIPAGGMDQRAATCNGQPRIEYTENLRLTGDGELARAPGYASAELSSVGPVAPDGTAVLLSDGVTLSVARTSLPLVYSVAGIGVSKAPPLGIYGQSQFALMQYGPSAPAYSQLEFPNSFCDAAGTFWATHAHSTGVWQVSGTGKTTSYTLWKNGVAVGAIVGLALNIPPHIMLSCAVNSDGTRICVGYSQATTGAVAFKIYNTSTRALVVDLTPTSTLPAHLHDCRWDSSGYWVCAWSGGIPATGNVRVESFNAVTGATISGATFSSGCDSNDYVYAAGAIGVYLCKGDTVASRLLACTDWSASRKASCGLCGYTLSSGVITLTGFSGMRELDGWLASGSPVQGSSTDEWLIPVTTLATAARCDGVAVVKSSYYAHVVGHWNDGLAAPAQSRNVRLAFSSGSLSYYGTRMQQSVDTTDVQSIMGGAYGNSPIDGTYRFLACDPYTVSGRSWGLLRAAGELVPGGSPFLMGNGSVLGQDSVPPKLAITTSANSMGWVGAFQIAACTEKRTAFGISRGPVGFVSFTTTTAVIPTLVLQSGYPRFNDFGGPGGQEELKVYCSVNGGPFLRLSSMIGSQVFASSDTVGLGQALTAGGVPQLDSSGPRLYSSGISAVGGVLPSYAPPSCTAAWESTDRYAVCGLVDYPNDVFFSKLRVTGEAPAFANVTNTQFHVTLPGAIVGVAKLPTCWVAWTESGTYAIYGDGPDDTGNNGSWEIPREVSRVGLMSPRSIASDGRAVYWQGKDGSIWAMDQGLAPQEIGALVRNLVSSNAEFATAPAKVVGAVYSPSSRLVQFLLESVAGYGTVLTWSPDAQAWGCEKLPYGGSQGGPTALALSRSSSGTWHTVAISPTNWIYECAEGQTPATVQTFTVRTNDMPLFGIGQEGQFTRASVAMFRPPLVTPLANDTGTAAAAVTVSLKYNGAPAVTDALDTVTVTPEAFAQQWTNRSSIPANESAFVEVSPRMQSDIHSVRVELTWDATVAAFSSLQLEGTGFQTAWRTGSSSRG